MAINNPVDALVEVASLHDPDMYYEWDELHVYMNPETKQLFWSHQSGCSCDMFEKPGDLGEFDGQSYDVGDVVAILRNWHPNIVNSQLDEEIRNLEAAVKAA